MNERIEEILLSRNPVQIGEKPEDFKGAMIMCMKEAYLLALLDVEKKVINKKYFYDLVAQNQMDSGDAQIACKHILQHIEELRKDNI